MTELVFSVDPASILAAETGDDAYSPGLLPVSLADIMAANIEPPRYAIEPLIPINHVTLLGAHGGAGKSVLALILVAHFAAGESWAGTPIPPPGRGLYLSLEDHGELMRLRLRRIIESCGLNPETVAENLKILDGTECGCALAEEEVEYGVRRLVETPLMGELREHAAGCGLIIVDNASDAYDGDEYHRRMVRAFVRMLARMARANGAAVLLLAHVDKAAARFGGYGNSYSGSTAWHNSARSRLALVEANGRVELRHEKLNLGRKADPIALRWDDAGVLVPVCGGDLDDEADLGTPDQDDDGCVLHAIEAAIAAGVTVPVSKTGPNNMLVVLRKMPELPRHLCNRAGSDRFWLAVERLRRAGVIAKEQYWTPARHVSEKWISIAGSDRAFIPHTPYAETRDRVFAGPAGCAGSPQPAKPAIDVLSRLRCWQAKDAAEREPTAYDAGEEVDAATARAAIASRYRRPVANCWPVEQEDM